MPNSDIIHDLSPTKSNRSPLQSDESSLMLLNTNSFKSKNMVKNESKESTMNNFINTNLTYEESSDLNEFKVKPKVLKFNEKPSNRRMNISSIVNSNTNRAYRNTQLANF